jgi:hypothetical protein
MKTRLMSYLTKYNIWSSEQCGFKQNLTTDNTTYTLTNGNLTAMNNKSKAGAIFCDNFISNSSYTKFPGVTMNNTLSWNNRIELTIKC